MTFKGDQGILNGSSCLLAILLRAQRRTSLQGKHTATVNIKKNYLIIWTCVKDYDFELEIDKSHSAWQLLTWSYNLTHSWL